MTSFRSGVTVVGLILTVLLPLHARADESSPRIDEETAWQAIEARYQHAVRDPVAYQNRERAALGERETALQQSIAAHERELAAVREQLEQRARLLARYDVRTLLGISGIAAFVLLLVHLLIYLRRTPTPPLPFVPSVLIPILLVLLALPRLAAD